MDAPFRKPRLRHGTPDWVEYPEFFITVCCKSKETNQLCDAKVADLIGESVTFRQKRGIWCFEILVLMPDHLHAILSVSEKRRIETEIRSWKRWISIKSGVVFQNGFFDHRLRGHESASGKWNYVNLNPVRRGLVKNAENWPFRWTRKDFEKGT